MFCSNKNKTHGIVFQMSVKHSLNMPTQRLLYGRNCIVLLHSAHLVISEGKKGKKWPETNNLWENEKNSVRATAIFMCVNKIIQFPDWNIGMSGVMLFIMQWIKFQFDIWDYKPIIWLRLRLYPYFKDCGSDTSLSALLAYIKHVAIVIITIIFNLNN